MQPPLSLADFKHCTLLTFYSLLVIADTQTCTGITEAGATQSKRRKWSYVPHPSPTLPLQHRAHADPQVELCNAGLYGRSAPVPGAREGLQKLKDMGYRLIIITARGESSREVSEDWIAEHMPDCEWPLGGR